MNQDPVGPIDRSIWEQNRQLVLDLLTQFNRELPNEEAACDWLYREIEECGLLVCHQCSSPDVEKLSSRLISCLNCRKSSCFTAGTFFHGVRQIRPYLAALFLKENGAVFSASWFADLLGIAVSTAACIVKKIGLVIVREMSEDAPVLFSASFASLICRRSRKTPADEHPRAEIDLISRQIDNGCVIDSQLIGSCAATQADIEMQNSDAAGESSASATTDLLMSENEKLVFDFLTAEPIDFDSLCELTGLTAGQLSAALVILELNGYSEVLQTGKFRRLGVQNKQNAVLEASNLDQDNVLCIAQATVKQIYRGISRKCLQIYIALFWCSADRLRWGRRALLKACLKHPLISYLDMVAYVSPPSIKVLPRILTV